MASEITITTQLTYRRNKQTGNFNYPALIFDQTTAGKQSGTWTVSHLVVTDLTLGEITTNGYIGLRNIDDSNPVDVGYNDLGVLRSLVTIKPGDVALFRLKTGRTLAGQATTAPVKVDYFAINE